MNLHVLVLYPLERILVTIVRTFSLASQTLFLRVMNKFEFEFPLENNTQLNPPPKKKKKIYNNKIIK